MRDTLARLMEAGRLSPLAYYFARFIGRGSGAGEDSLLAHAAALLSTCNQRGDVCVDLDRYAGEPLFDGLAEEAPPLGGGGPGSGGEVLAPATTPPAVKVATTPRWPALPDWLSALRAHAPWVGAAGERAPLILDGQRLYLGKYWDFEQRVACSLLRRIELVEALDRSRLTEALARLFPQAAPDVVDWQKVAAAVAAARRFAVISGGPGTGKTTTVVKVLALLLGQDTELRIALAAPTGKAAARLGEAVRDGKVRVKADAEVLARIPEEARTIHRLLGWGFDEGFRHNAENPLPLDCLVVDEASMIDLPLMARLLEALPGHARLILLGDRDQLASVEAGNVLGDITGHGQEIRYTARQVAFLEGVGAAPQGSLPAGSQPPSAADTVGLLRVSYRFRPDSGLGALARAVNAGQGEVAHGLLSGGRYGDIAWVEAPSDTLHPACVDWAAERYAEYLRQADVADALRSFERARVLAALHRGPFGVDELNRRIAARLQAQGLIQGGEEYHGKPVMVTANDYEAGLFNGDIGLLWRDAEGVLRACFLLAEGQVRSVSARQLPEHACAYALTVHKSQGSELDEVLLVLPPERSPVVTRELIYTGITRARCRVLVQGRRAAFLEGCRERVQRSSALAERLGWGPGLKG